MPLGADHYELPLFVQSFKPYYREDFQAAEEAIAANLGIALGKRREHEEQYGDEISYDISSRLQLNRGLTKEDIADLFADKGLAASDVEIRECWFSSLPWNLRSMLSSLSYTRSGSTFYLNKLAQNV